MENQDNKKKKDWHYYSNHGVWSKVIAGVILAILSALFLGIKGFIEQLSWKEISKTISDYWFGTTLISNKLIIIIILIYAIPIIALIISSFTSTSEDLKALGFIEREFVKLIRALIALVKKPLELFDREFKNIEKDKNEVKEIEIPFHPSAHSEVTTKKNIEKIFEGTWKSNFVWEGKHTTINNIAIKDGYWWENGKKVFYIRYFTITSLNPFCISFDKVGMNQHKKVLQNKLELKNDTQLEGTENGEWILYTRIDNLTGK